MLPQVTSLEAISQIWHTSILHTDTHTHTHTHTSYSSRPVRGLMGRPSALLSLLKRCTGAPSTFSGQQAHGCGNRSHQSEAMSRKKENVSGSQQAGEAQTVWSGVTFRVCVCVCVCSIPRILNCGCGTYWNSKHRAFVLCSCFCLKQDHK